MKKSIYISALRVAVIYLLISTVWIFASDYVLLLWEDDVETYQLISSIKGTFFIIVSAFIIYYLVHTELIHVEKAQKDITHLKEFDSLTGLHNRHSFNKEIARIREEFIQVSVIMFDINGLKLINEMYSSEEGDELLVDFARLLNKNMPNNTFIARIGGDEFCGIIYDCDYEKVSQYAKLIEDECLNHKVQDIEMTAAIGYSTTCEKHLIDDSLRLAESRMFKHKLLTAKSASNQIITSLKTTLFERSDETEQHASRLEDYVILIGQELGLQDSDINDMKLLAILHDIGKIGIDDNILRKPAKLTEEEYIKMQQHPVIGYKIASSVQQLEGISYFILTHHERWDGNGYPKQLKGTEIPLASRILAIVDAYDAMTNDRVYRKALSHEAAIKELIDNKETQFDPALVDLFVRILKNHPEIG